MNACTNPHNAKFKHWYEARARHADGRPKPKRRPTHARRRTQTVLDYCHEFRPVIWGYVMIWTGVLL